MSKNTSANHRPPHRRRGPALPPPRKRDRPKRVLQRHDLLPPLVSQRAPARGRQEDEQEPGQLYTLDDLAAKGFSTDGGALRPADGTPAQAAQLHPRFPARGRKALNHAARVFRDSLPATGGDPAALASVMAALDDDLNTPAAFGALFTRINHAAPPDWISGPSMRPSTSLGWADLDLRRHAQDDAPPNVTALAAQALGRQTGQGLRRRRPAPQGTHLPPAGRCSTARTDTPSNAEETLVLPRPPLSSAIRAPATSVAILSTFMSHVSPRRTPSLRPRTSSRPPSFASFPMPSSTSVLPRTPGFTTTSTWTTN
jgi:hypothetical protein